jgi:hypothetical protein
MDSDLSALLMAANAGATRQSVQVAVMRKAHEMDQAVLQLIDDGMKNQVAVSGPPAADGTGRVVDKHA